MLGFSPLGAVALGELSNSQKAVAADAATFTLTGNDAGLYASRFLTADSGAFAFAGFDVEFIRSGDRTFIPDAGTFTLTGNEAGLYPSRLVVADAGTFTFTGYGVEFIRTSKGLRVIPGGGSRGLAARASGGSKGLRISA